MGCNFLLADAERVGLFFPVVLRRFFIIGGGMIYKAFLPWCEKAYITHVYHTFEADTYLPDLEKQAGWKLTSVSDRYTNEPEGEQPAMDYEFRIYERQNG